MIAKDFFLLKFQSLIEEQNRLGYTMLQSHYGPMGTEENVNTLAYNLESLLIESGEKKGVVKRLFSLIIEALQNIRLHGGHDLNGEQLAYYVCANNNETQEYVITTSNILLNKNIHRVQPKIDKINSLDRAGLKEYYLETLTDGERSVKGGAGLGFITVAMKSKNIINYDIIDLGNDMSFFQMQTNVVTLKEED